MFCSNNFTFYFSSTNKIQTLQSQRYLLKSSCEMLHCIKEKWNLTAFWNKWRILGNIFSGTPFILGVPKKLVSRNLNQYDSFCLKEQFYGSKLGRNMEKSSSMAWQLLILVEEPPTLLKLPLKCSQGTGKII